MRHKEETRRGDRETRGGVDEGSEFKVGMQGRKAWVPEERTLMNGVSMEGRRHV